MHRTAVAAAFVLLCGHALADEMKDLSDEQGTGKLYFTGPGYTINLIPQAILLGLLSFLAVYFLGLDLFGTSTSTGSGYGAPAAYGAPEPSYGAPAASYSAPAAGYDAPASGYSASGRYYDTYNQAGGESLAYDDAARRKRSAF